MSPLIEFAGTSKSFEKDGSRMRALDDVSLRIDDGEFIAIVGPSGCGKSTLLNLAAGLMRPTSGSVRYRGQEVASINREVGFVTQKDNLLPWRTVERNVGMALELQGIRRKDRARRVGEIIEQVGLTGFERHYPAELSGGMRKRVTLARTLIYSPSVLLMDEPFGALDAQLKMMLQGELLRLWSELRQTVVFVTHDLIEAVALADRVVVMSARPARVLLVQDTGLPRPRHPFDVRFSDHFQKVSTVIWETLETEVGRGTDV